MQAAQALLLAAVRAAPRRYGLPPLPSGIEAARAAGIEGALACAIDAARASAERGTPAPEDARSLFTEALGAFLREAMAPQGGDPFFQALVLQAGDAQVREFAHLAAVAAADQRAVRAMTDAIAHPGKTRQLPPGPARAALEQLHGLAGEGAWARLAATLQGGPYAALSASAPLQRLLRHEALQAHDAVRRWLALRVQRSPVAGSRAAVAQGRSAARAGADAERATIEAFLALARLLESRVPGAYRVLRGLRPPPGFPGDPGKAKDEWDAAIACGAGATGAAILLLAEVKASPAAASSDFSRLQRGLQRLAQADPQRSYDFACADGIACLSGASLRALQAGQRTLPPGVIYCCTAPPEQRPPLLAAASKAVLAAEPASLDYAQRLARGAAVRDDDLLPVWEALLHAPRLRATLHQDATARLVRAAMLHPADLVASLAAL